MGAIMANITRIKAKDNKSDKKSSSSMNAETFSRKVSIKAKNSGNKKAEKAKAKAAKKEAKMAARAGKKAFILFRPFIAFGRYIRDSFREVRQVRWPDRKATWKLVLSVIVYVILTKKLLQI